MKDISCIKHGTIYKASPQSLIPWARKIDPRNPYNQAYGQYIRVEVTEGEHAGESWMIDTWDIDGGYINMFEQIRDMVEINAYGLGHYRGRAYYNSCVQLLPENVDLFEELCDLHDFELLDNRSDRNVSHYSAEDVVEWVWLAHEHKYPNGETLVRKGADVTVERKAKALFDKVQSEYLQSPIGFGFQYALHYFYKYAMENRDASCIQDYLPAVNDMAYKSEAASEIVYDKKTAAGQMSFDF